MIDFCIKAYTDLIKSLQSAGFSFVTFEQYLNGNLPEKFVILRHDVDLLPYNSKVFAQIQNQFGVSGSYYFRAVPESWDVAVIKEIAALGHEVGYHYENMDTVNAKNHNGGSRITKGTEAYEKLIDQAYEDFCYNLDELRKLTPVHTICMHGSPKSRFDNKELWNKYDYRKLEIIGEPYYDADFDDLFYLTDTGRRWDGYKFSVRDKVPQQDSWIKNNLSYHSTFDLIKDLQQPESDRRLPDKIMFTFHPQRWHSSKLLWLKERIMQSLKNSIKKYFFVNR
jgi:hypothetical protein